MDTLASLLKEIKTAQKIIDTPLDGWDPRTVPGMVLAQNQAKMSIDGLKLRYRDLVKQNSVNILVVGPKAKVKQFADIATKEGPTLNVDGNKLYATLAEEAFPSMGSDKTFTAHQGFIVLNRIRDLCKDLKIEEMRSMDRLTAAYVPTPELFLKETISLVHQALDSQLNLKYLEREAVDAAIKSDYDGAVVPVLIFNLPEVDIQDVSTKFLAGKTTVVKLESDKDVTKESVIKVFSEIKKSLKKEKANE